jgi:hypothetical protein
MLLRRGPLTTTYIRTAKCDTLNGNDREQKISFAECMGGYVEIKNSEGGSDMLHASSHHPGQCERRARLSCKIKIGNLKVTQRRAQIDGHY